MNFKYKLLIATSILNCTNVYAATYYIDAKNGNDAWGGTTSTVSSSNGPWQSIAKVNSVQLQPGDNVLFSCGQSWNETLKPWGNGSATAKINFGSYPSGCANKPKITGFKSIPSHNWQPHGGNIWKTTFPQNLIINSNFSSSVSNWGKWPSDANLSLNATCPASVAGCMNFIAGASTTASLASSDNFPIIAGKVYVVTLSFYAPSNFSSNIIVRENGNSYKVLGLSQKITGNDNWQDVSFEFTAKNTLPNARLDIEVPKAKQIYLRYARLNLKEAQAKPNMVLFDGDPVTIAHHPNAGHDASRPESVFLRTSGSSTAVADAQGRQGSSYITVSDLKLPSGVSISPETKMRIRPLDFAILDFSVTETSTNTISITPNTPYPLAKPGLGYYFYDAMWMLDSPGEWFYDKTTQTLYLWTPTNENPGSRVSVASLNTAINLYWTSNYSVDNLEIDGAWKGINMEYATNATLKNLYVHNIVDRAFGAEYSKNASIASSQISRVGQGIFAQFATNSVIENNVISEVGVFMKEGKKISLPMVTSYGIVSGSNSFVSNNVLSDIAGDGIRGTASETNIDTNQIQRSCLSFNDCGAIYIGSTSLKTEIKNNLILDVPGDTDGIADGSAKLTNGIYLDEGISGTKVTGNIVKGATNSIHVHDGSQNTISGNIFYGADRYLVWQQEEPWAVGSIKENVIKSNQLFPTTSEVPLVNQSKSGDTSKFATYSDNHYSTIYSPNVAREYSELGLSTAYTLPEWQAAKAPDGTHRNNDSGSSAPAPLPSFALGMVGNNFINNSDFSAGLKGWGSWNSTAPYSKEILEGCLPASTNCIHVVAGGSETLTNSPRFALTKGKSYRVTFDIKATLDNASLLGIIRHAGPSNYNSLVHVPYRISTSTDWKRHSFVFEATEDALNPTVPDQGGRFDIQGLPANQGLWIANLEIAPFNPGVLGPTRSDLLVNKTDIISNVDCPTRRENLSLCANYFNFPEATATVWPVSVAPNSARIVFTQNVTLIDSDADGIANSQDSCTSTVKGLAVNGNGCSLSD